MAYRIFDAEHKHLVQIEQLEESCFSVPWTMEQLEGQLPDEHHCFLVAMDGEQVLGYAGMMFVLDEGYISNVAVDPAVRQQGIGDHLLKDLLLRAEKLTLSFVTLEVRESNLPAIGLYTKHGFEKVGLRKKYYDFPKEDAILMTKFLK